MADAAKSNAAKEFFEKFGEKLALGVALLILVGYAVVAFGMSSDDPSLGAIEKNIKDVKNEERTPHAEMTAPNTENWQARAINPWNTVVTTARNADDWSGFLVTKAEGKGQKREIIKAVPVIVPEVKFLNAEVAIDSITVTWDYKDFTNQDVQKLAREKDPALKKDPAKASHFVLERQVAGGKWEIVADKLDTKVLSYVDTKIEPKSKYAYRVTAYSTDPNYLKRGGAIDPETGAQPNPEGKVNVAAGPPIQTLGIWKLTFRNPMKQPDAKGMVYVLIEKFEKGHGKVEKAHMQYDGDLIGSWEETQGAEPTTKHRVNVKGGKSIEVDFNTNTTLISVVKVNLPVEVKRCKAIYAKDGNKIDCEKVIEKRNFDTSLITYKDDEGVKKVHVPSPASLDQLCEEHGGRKIITTLPKDTKDSPDEPKTDPKEAARLKKEAEAEKLFEEAEKALEKNKSLAKTYYTRLMSSEFKDTDFVSKNKKPIIEERIAGLNKK